MLLEDLNTKKHERRKEKKEKGEKAGESAEDRERMSNELHTTEQMVMTMVALPQRMVSDMHCSSYLTSQDLFL